jgi:hypothetical protein
MKISIYGPRPDGLAVAEILRHIPEGAKEAIIQAPLRRAIDLRPCQRPGVLEISASVDNKVFIHLSQDRPDSTYKVVVT